VFSVERFAVRTVVVWACVVIERAVSSSRTRYVLGTPLRYGELAPWAEPGMRVSAEALLRGMGTEWLWTALSQPVISNAERMREAAVRATVLGTGSVLT
jgi:hypothetical protein